jgi:hypothetical protein
MPHHCELFYGDVAADPSLGFFFALNDTYHKIEGVVINKQGRREEKKVVHTISC